MKNNTFESVPLLRIVVSLMAGIVVGEYVAIALPIWPFFILLLVATLLLWKFPLLQSTAIALCFLVLGVVLMQRQKTSSRVEWPEEEVCYEAVVLSEPVEKPKTMAVDIMLPANHRKLKCYLYKDERSRGLRIGDGLKIQSRIKANSEWHIGTFDYRRYLENHGFTGSTFVSSWKWRKVQLSLSNLSYLERTKLFFLKQRSKLLARFSSQGMADESYAVVAAMALGDKSALTIELKDTYSVTGASHVLALSGLHLGIIYTLLSLLIAGRRWQMLSQLVLILSIWAFVFLVGMSVSVVRSAVMLSLYALLSLGHRDKMSANTLAFTAIVLLMINPQSLFDVGFQMSFMAVFAILLFLPIFEAVFSQQYLMDHRLLKWVWSMFAISFSAQLGVAPLIAYYFGRFSTYFLLTNFIVVPAAALILWLSLVVLVVPSLAFLLVRVVDMLNVVLTRIASIPGASIEGLHPSVIQVAMMYVIIGSVWLLLFRLWQRG